MNNNQLRQDVLDELDFEPSVDARGIGIAAEDGVVTLTGHVPSYAQKMVAEEAVRRVKGVLAIANEVDVRYPADKETSDDEIAKRIVNMFEWNEMIPQEAVQVTVQQGWVTLRGEVAWRYQRNAVEVAVRKLSGVLGVINNISLRPSVTSDDVKKKIESALIRHAEIEAEAIQVTVHEDNKVSLEGTVSNWDERVAVANAAWSVQGVQSVEDRLVVAP